MCKKWWEKSKAASLLVGVLLTKNSSNRCKSMNKKKEIKKVSSVHILTHLVFLLLSKRHYHNQSKVFSNVLALHQQESAIWIFYFVFICFLSAFTLPSSLIPAQLCNYSHSSVWQHTWSIVNQFVWVFTKNIFVFKKWSISKKIHLFFHLWTLKFWTFFSIFYIILLL